MSKPNHLHLTDIKTALLMFIHLLFVGINIKLLGETASVLYISHEHRPDCFQIEPLFNFYEAVNPSLIKKKIYKEFKRERLQSHI